jgi:uncharacterized protein YciW
VFVQTTTLQSLPIDAGPKPFSRSERLHALHEIGLFAWYVHFISLSGIVAYINFIVRNRML